MLGKTHALALALLLLWLRFDYVAVAAGIVGALLPDIDTEKSLLGRFISVGRFGHRTATHSLLALALSGLGVWFPLGRAFFLGYLSHLILDMLTPQGITLLYPKLTSFILLGGSIPTGSWKETAITVLLLLSSLAILTLNYLGLGRLEALRIIMGAL
jgi:inner membrane protein